jgi:Response regulator containing CheY-like receiver domain and AraC-type DNA-binding domain
MASSVTCLVADDHPAVLSAVCAVLEDSGIDVVGRARNGAEALELIQTLKPRVALLDVRMPQMSGIEIARQSLRTTPETGILLYTGYAERALMRRSTPARGGSC